jgi:hypothetical protein
MATKYGTTLPLILIKLYICGPRSSSRPALSYVKTTSDFGVWREDTQATTELTLQNGYGMHTIPNYLKFM